MREATDGFFHAPDINGFTLTIVDDPYWAVRLSLLFQVLMRKILGYCCRLRCSLVADIHNTTGLHKDLKDQSGRQEEKKETRSRSFSRYLVGNGCSKVES